jgi:imidazolonepropionase-like amidohydrolase
VVLAAIIDEAHKQGLPATTHPMGTPSLAASIDAGADAIEHPAIAVALDNPPDVTFISPQLAARMAKQKVYGVSLLVALEVYATYFKNPELLDDVQRMGNVPEGMLAEGQRFVKESIAKGAGPSLWEARYANTLKNMKTLIDAGVPIVMGTDSGTRLNYHQSANHVREMEILEGLGMTPLEVITSATLRGAQLLGHDRDLGSLEPGKLADVIVVDGNPLVDMGAMRHVEMVFKAGVRYR